MDPIAELRSAVVSSVVELAGESAKNIDPTFERPPRPDFGDYSTNAALLLAPVLGEKPRDVAERLGGLVTKALGVQLDRFEIAGPGFLNLFMTDSWYISALATINEPDASFGSRGAQQPERVLVEFVSANPTGPLTAAGGRHAAYGDALASILEFHGHSVEREYYVNDYGGQVQKLGLSIQARANGDDVPEGGYEGEYVSELAAEIPNAADADPPEIARAGVEILIGRVKSSLANFGVEFDSWFSERTLHEDGEVERAISELGESGGVYEKDGASWLKTEVHGDDKDRVLRRSGGEHTYFAADIAYHENKLAREPGFERLINVWGADHHGYVARMKAAVAALGGDPERLEVVIMQFVNLIERGERASMSKRRGDFVTLDDLVAEIGVDAARFLMLQRSHDTTVDLDLDLAREQSAENPVYYVQYAHARICSILTKAGEELSTRALAASETPGALGPSERDLVKKLLAFPVEIEEAASKRAPHRIAVYALELAQTFTAFYRDCQVVGVEPEIERFRVALSIASRDTVARALALLGVSAPEHM